MLKIFKIIATYLMPISLFSSEFFYIFLWIFNFDDNEYQRKGILICLLALFWILISIRFSILYYEHKKKRKDILKVCLVPFIWIIAFILALINNGTEAVILKTFGCFILYSLPVFMVTVIISVEKIERNFIGSFRWIAIGLFPIIIYYVARILFRGMLFSEFSVNLGKLNYVSIAWVCLAIVIFVALDFVINYEETCCFYKKMMVGGIILFSSAIVLSGAKGIIICLAIFIFCLAWWSLFYKKKSKILKIVATMILINILIFSVSGINTKSEQGLDRSRIFAQELIEDYKNNNYSILAREYGYMKILEKKEIESAKEVIGSRTTGRIYLYELSISESLDYPWFGMGSMGFTVKYGEGFYPHNFILELLADWGYPITIVFLVLMIFIYKKMYFFIDKDPIIISMLIFFFVNSFKQMVYGSIYLDSILLMSVTYYFSKIYFHKN